MWLLDQRTQLLAKENYLTTLPTLPYLTSTTVSLPEPPRPQGSVAWRTRCWSCWAPWSPDFSATPWAGPPGHSRALARQPDAEASVEQNSGRNLYCPDLPNGRAPFLDKKMTIRTSHYLWFKVWAFNSTTISIQVPSKPTFFSASAVASSSEVLPLGISDVPPRFLAFSNLACDKQMDWNRAKPEKQDLSHGCSTRTGSGLMRIQIRHLVLTRIYRDCVTWFFTSAFSLNIHHPLRQFKLTVVIPKFYLRKRSGSDLLL